LISRCRGMLMVRPAKLDLVSAAPAASRLVERHAVLGREGAEAPEKLALLHGTLV
jgi:hypothetical protein